MIEAKRYDPKYLHRKSCDGCMYLGWTDGKFRCNYILFTGEPRGCPANRCTKKKSLHRRQTVQAHSVK